MSEGQDNPETGGQTGKPSLTEQINTPPSGLENAPDWLQEKRGERASKIVNEEVNKKIETGPLKKIIKKVGEL